MSQDAITRFDGTKYGFLSNFHICDVEYNGVKYNHTEGAFQAQKTHDKALQEKIATLSPSEAKRACGRRGLTLSDGTRISVNLRLDWEEVKDNEMHQILLAKFTQNPELKQMLLDTGARMLVEGNTWHDNYWGDCQCVKCMNIVGKNTLGKLLMQVREELKYEV